MKTPHTIVSTKGQVVVPSRVRDRHQIDDGTSVRVTVQDDGIRIVRRSGWADATAGCLTSPVPPMSPEELEAAIKRDSDEELRERWGADT